MAVLETEVIDRPANDGEHLQHLQRLADWMDTAFAIPGTRFRVGWDAIIGLIPGIGDTATSLVSFYILQSATRGGVSRLTLARMAANLALDYLLGSIPLVGDLFDATWKSNQKNVALLRRELESSPQTVRKNRLGDWVFLSVLIAALLLILVGSVTVTYLTVRWIGRQLLT